MNDVLLEFFAVRNREGKWFRRKGYGGSGATWVDNLKKARIYNKVGGARSQISYFANNYPSYGIPDLVKFTCSSMEVIDETQRIADQKKRKEKAEKKWALVEKQQALRDAQEKFDRAKKDLEQLHGLPSEN